MAHDIKRERTRNITSESEIVRVSVDSSTAIKLFDAETIKESERLSVYVSNSNNQGCWVRKFPAALNNDKVGIFIRPNSSKQIFMADNPNTAEISVIMDSGGTKTIVAELY